VPRTFTIMPDDTAMASGDVVIPPTGTFDKDAEWEARTKAKLDASGVKDPNDRKAILRTAGLPPDWAGGTRKFTVAPVPTEAKPSPTIQTEGGLAERTTGTISRDVERGLKKVGVPDDVAEEFGTILYKAGPHNAVDAAFQAAGMLIPFAGKAAPIFDEFAPSVANYLRTLGEAPAMSLKGSTARALTTGAITGGAAAVTGQPIAPATAEGAIGSEIAEPIGALASKGVGLSAAEKGVTETATDEAIAKTQTEAITKGTGVSPGRAEVLSAKSPEAAYALADTKRALKASRNAIFEEGGQKFEPFYGPANNRPLDPSDVDQIHEGVAQSLGTVATRGQERELSAGVKKQIDDLGKLKTISNDDAQTMVKQAFEDMLLPRNEQRHPELLDAIKDTQATGSKPMSMEDLAQLATEKEGITIGKLRGRLSSLMKGAMAPGATQTDRRAVFEATKPITEILDNAVPEELRPALQKVKDEYAQDIHLFPWRQQHALHVASTLPELGQTFFEKGQPAAIEALIDKADPEQKALFREAWGSYLWKKAEKDPASALKLLADNRGTVGKLFPNTDFQNVATWADMIRGAGRMSKQSLASANLPTRRQFYADLTRQLRAGLTPEMVTQAEAAIRESGAGPKHFSLRWAERMGVLGAIAGYGAFAHRPELYLPLAAYELGHTAWTSLVNHPEALGAYRTFVTNPWTRQGADAAARLLIGGIHNAMTAPGDAPPPLPKVAPTPNPLPTIAAAWKATPAGKDRDALRAQMSARIKTEWSSLSDKDKKALSPILAEMYRPKPTTHHGAGA
jgi:hypothetical protein